jgi:hypothetical protein
MSFYESRARVEKIEGTHRRVTLETGDVFDTGVHGAVKAHYKLEREKDLPLPVDYVVGATGA